MERGVWKKPVVLEMYGRPGSVVITGTLDAALMLIGAWPTKRTEAHIAAVVTCRDVLSGGSDAGLARANFIEAAFEAGYRIQPETFLNERWDLAPLAANAQDPPVGLAAMIKRRAASPAGANGSEAQEREATVSLPSGKGISPRAEPQESMRDLLRHLVALLGLIGQAFGRSVAGLFGSSMPRRTGRQVH